MKRITLYDESKEVDPLEKVFFGQCCERYITKEEMKENYDLLVKQKNEYETRNQTFLSEERKRNWLD